MRSRVRMFAASAATSLLLTVGTAAVGPSASAASLTCTEATRKYSASGEYMFIPVYYPTLNVNCLMRRGNTGGGVHYLQEVLRDQYGYNIAVDGDFGPATESALKSLQSRLHITADGVYGPQTRDSICWPLYWEPDACWWYDE
ncbi:Zinc D-Ala-D-Ala carboxypeptidase [Streptomyces sp. MBT84]|uniref:peptidoglycan-binding domain-containing protein n=1 Tax=unclassified Streptomyces TaxID=2593676 RepID=UPI001C6F08AB|nr:peptidoglycan-binding domain-containing protein [Streptomyces sp. MBT84]MBW8705482.1 Zinc D-Ala-D-Ala carboxypeptidase [Streptomyces sp. MBT84]